MAFIDVHCHLDICEKPQLIIKDALKKDVKIIITNGTNPETNSKSLELSKKYSIVKAALGIYPMEALKLSNEQINDEIDKIRKNNENIVAIGEVGLDFKEDAINHERQKEIFKKFVDLSISLNKPIIVHSRKAEKECIEILELLKAKKVIMHCFSGKFSLISKIANNGWYLSIPASIKNSEHFQKIAKEIPIENLLCETDSPYLHPDKLRNNNPCFVKESYKKIAECKNLNVKEVEEKIEQNFQKLFNI